MSWDERKRGANLAKHGIDVDLASRIFQAEVVEREDNRRDYGERRMIAYGEVDGIVLCVIYTRRDGVRRMISARRAGKLERQDYHAGTSGQGSP